MLPTKLLAVMLPDTARVPLPYAIIVLLTLPSLTVNPVKLPTLVIFGCAAVVNVPDTKLAVNKLPALTLVPAILPVTVNTLVDLLKVKLALPPNSPASLN